MEKEKYELFKTDRVEFVAEIYKYENCLNFLIESNGFKGHGAYYFVDVKSEVTDNGQELEGYYRNKELKKIVHSVGLSNTMITTQFYFDKVNLIFVLRKKFQTIDENGNLRKPKLTSESRFYFVNGNVINQNEKINQEEVSVIKQQAKIYQNDLKAF